MIVDGRAIAADILAATKEEVAKLPHAPVVRAVVVTPSPATESYLKVKSARAEDAGMTMETVRIPDDASNEAVIAAVTAPGADAIIVQLPLPKHLDLDAILASIPREKDADVLSPEAYADFEQGSAGALMPPVAAAIAEICARSSVEVAGAKALVVGNGRLVGQPVWHWLHQQGAAALIVTRATQSTLPALLPNMDIVVSGAGSPGLITPEHLKQGVVLIDAGTSESSGAIVGDADPACAQTAAVFTPVPGGVGPVAVACLFRNAAILVIRAKQALLTNPEA
ncbi:MAG TPA: bifunctional 5,10-methylenetetrahydrofolate dehydrogenase/5,10-methenyltetrahydrofolate cyclohydrolase [Candidatus Paceibacterota bacterium]|jgi:methylenetetrahydrofolate dehydrogenase (NADP+)/methenyltetrahydrofolate cyclohydrolase|nr:bifunctional 5,10-methylenetetrahydrofolate dehydrogenase/5,10-methenyltetrahydrofolate cyclohydrolase [Candidatus Paceibacterota bacterium]